jgi:hypothetical protein
LYEESEDENGDYEEEEFSIHILSKNSTHIHRSLSSDFLMNKRRNKYNRCSYRSCYALSTADEREELEYVSSRATSESKNTSIDKDECDDKMSVSEDMNQEHMSISDNENEEEIDQVEDDLTEFATRRRSQLFIPHSKSDGHLLCSEMKRPRTPCFDESLNSENNFIIFNSNTPTFIRHSATYSGQEVPPTLRISSGRSFIERLKDRQRSKDDYKRKQSEPIKVAEVPENLVESFDIDCCEQENIPGTYKSFDFFNRVARSWLFHKDLF